MNIFIRSIKLLCLLLLLQVTKQAGAQNEAFHGGAGAGMISASSSAISCNIYQFAGGNGSGENKLATAITNCSQLHFSGGNGGGNNITASSTLACNVSRFRGDSSGGFNNGRTQLVTCNTSRFAGDSADGFAINKTNSLNCNTSRFAGDTGSGYNKGLFIKPRNFLGNDTSITIICTEERFNLLSLYLFQGITIAWNTVKPDSAAIGNYRAIGTTLSGCIDTAYAVIQQEIAVWNGTASNNWHIAANWNSNKVPTEITHVIIPGNTPNPCIISNADAKAASVQGKINGNFSIINNRNLFISGHCVQLPTGP